MSISKNQTILVIDVGNTHTVLGVYEQQRLQKHFRLHTDPHRTEDEYTVMIRGLLQELPQLTNFSGAIVASVVPPVTPLFESILKDRFSVEPIVVGPGTKTGISIRYDSPRDVGADRIVNSVAGFARYAQTQNGPYGVIIVDFGTATTFDVVSPKAEYLGGAIAPGVLTATEALFGRTAKLPRIDIKQPKSAIGTNTTESMQAGIFYGYAALVDGIVKQMMSELSFTPYVLSTGGLAVLFANQCKTIHATDPFLTLEGLRLIYEQN